MEEDGLGADVQLVTQSVTHGRYVEEEEHGFYDIYGFGAIVVLDVISFIMNNVMLCTG